MNEIRKAERKLEKSQASILLIEEISELITEISLYLVGEGSLDHIAEELVDVEIMTSLVMTSFGISNKSVSKNMDKLHKKEDIKLKLSVFTHDTEEVLKYCIKHLSVFQKVVCKKNRGRHNKKDISEAIASVNISIDLLISICGISKKRCDKWRSRKLKRLRKRSKKNKIV